MIASYYKDTNISINNMRHAMGYSGCGGTNAPSGVKGLAHYGISAAWGIISPTEVKAKVNKKIPVDIAIMYSKIPKLAKYRQDMTFMGSHSVVACKVISVNGVAGMAIRDPDHQGANKPNYLFWPDSVWIPAFHAMNNVAVYPNKPKEVPTYPYSATPYSHTVKTLANLQVRTAPNKTASQHATFLANTTHAVKLITLRGGSYTAHDGTTKNTWYGLKLGTSSTWYWIAAGWTKVI
jgi:hypothetical protein